MSSQIEGAKCPACACTTVAGEWGAVTPIALNIAEGSTGQSNSEQNKFLGYALRSYLETVASLDLIELRNYLSKEEISPIREQGHELFIKLAAFRKALR